MKLKIGETAPEFVLPDEKGKLVTLSSYRGKFVVLYFYPKDDTPGCTTEACNFRDDYSDFVNAGVDIIGISPDNSQSHAKFIQKYQLPFTLLADADHQICDLYGTWGRKKNMGREYDGVFRTTFLINPEGLIEKVFEKVKPADHSQEILEFLKNN